MLSTIARGYTTMSTIAVAVDALSHLLRRAQTQPYLNGCALQLRGIRCDLVWHANLLPKGRLRQRKLPPHQVQPRYQLSYTVLDLQPGSNGAPGHLAQEKRAQCGMSSPPWCIIVRGGKAGHGIQLETPTS